MVCIAKVIFLKLFREISFQNFPGISWKLDFMKLAGFDVDSYTEIQLTKSNAELDKDKKRKITEEYKINRIQKKGEKVARNRTNRSEVENGYTYKDLSAREDFSQNDVEVVTKEVSEVDLATGEISEVDLATGEISEIELIVRCKCKNQCASRCGCYRTHSSCTFWCFCTSNCTNQEKFDCSQELDIDVFIWDLETTE
jgi:hypothetical protein